MKELVEGVDFYYSETGLIVFTEKYHPEKGYCCGMSCRHCPYQIKTEQSITSLNGQKENNSRQAENS
jgi:hypothetical protein